MKNITYASSEWSDEAAHLRSLARAFAVCNKKKGCKWRLRPNCLYQLCDLGTYPICEQRKTRRACTLAQSRQSLRWLHWKKGYRWRLRPNCLYQLCDLGTYMYMYRIFEQQKTRRACTFAQSCQIMFELLSSCEREYLLSTLEKSEKNLPWRPWFLHMHKS